LTKILPELILPLWDTVEDTVNLYLESIIKNSRPGRRRQAFENAVRELLSREVTVFQQGTSFNFNVSNGTKLFSQSTERVE
jgi:hypothetical protein